MAVNTVFVAAGARGHVHESTVLVPHDELEVLQHGVLHRFVLGGLQVMLRRWECGGCGKSAGRQATSKRVNVCGRRRN